MSEMKTILLVDDDEDLVYQNKLLLENNGFKVIEAYNRKEAMKILSKPFRPEQLIGAINKYV